MLDHRMSTYYLLLVEKGDFSDEFNLSKNEIKLPNVLIAYRVIFNKNTDGLIIKIDHIVIKVEKQKSNFLCRKPQNR